MFNIYFIILTLNFKILVLIDDIFFILHFSTIVLTS